ncbi:hypothetical protein E2562_018194 [Oryza meyeriana var. granulata]|uniref:Uncharacterized protein n=1 Tax=Oryza meyeriana var. granulata TaxID=110450 RepID=A0A6G1C768_9ORYZ|nr:hypothetical protein E2562_018194 [Oryza meyeriana var. granulata]
MRRSSGVGVRQLPTPDPAALRLLPDLAPCRSRCDAISSPRARNYCGRKVGAGDEAEPQGSRALCSSASNIRLMGGKAPVIVVC